MKNCFTLSELKPESLTPDQVEWLNGSAVDALLQLEDVAKYVFKVADVLDIPADVATAVSTYHYQLVAGREPADMIKHTAFFYDAASVLMDPEVTTPQNAAERITALGMAAVGVEPAAIASAPITQ